MLRSLVLITDFNTEYEKIKEIGFKENRKISVYKRISTDEKFAVISVDRKYTGLPLATVLI